MSNTNTQDNKQPEPDEEPEGAPAFVMHAGWRQRISHLRSAIYAIMENRKDAQSHLVRTYTLPFLPPSFAYLPNVDRAKLLPLSSFC